MPYRNSSFKDEKPTMKERIQAALREVYTFFKKVLFAIGDWFAEFQTPILFGLFIMLLFAYGMNKIIGGGVTSCVEGGTLLQPGQVTNCSSSQETIHTKETAQGTVLYCSCPGHDHSNEK